MAQNPHEIVAPVPVYSSEHELLSRLSQELQKEREKNFNLARNLALEKHKSQQLECYFLSLSTLKNQTTEPLADSGKCKKIQSCETFASFADLNEPNIQIGSYPTEVRKEKIRKYKEKIKKYRKSVQISRVFSGRSVIAKIKPRVNGKFVKSAALMA